MSPLRRRCPMSSAAWVAYEVAVIHELGHAYAAESLGLTVTAIRLPKPDDLDGVRVFDANSNGKMGVSIPEAYPGNVNGELYIAERLETPVTKIAIAGAVAECLHDDVSVN